MPKEVTMRRICGWGASSLLLACMLVVSMPGMSGAAMMGRGADFFSGIGDAMRDADNARDRYYQYRSSRDAARYEREWREYEYRLEQARIERMARETKISPDRLRRMREDGRSWKSISDHYRIDPRRIGYGHRGPHGYDRDHDNDLRHRIYRDHPGKARGHYKGTPGGPPGQYKKHKNK